MALQNFATTLNCVSTLMGDRFIGSMNLANSEVNEENESCFICINCFALLYLICFICYALSAMLYLLFIICYTLSAMLNLLCFIRVLIGFDFFTTDAWTDTLSDIVTS